MKPKIVIFSLILIATLWPPLAFADSKLSLKISPLLIPIKLETNQEVKRSIILENSSSQDEHIQIRIKPISVSNDGIVKLLDDDDPKASDFSDFRNQVQFLVNDTATDNFTLASRERQEVQMIISPKDNQNVSDYYFSVLFSASSLNSLPNPKDQKSIAAHASTKLEVAANVLLSTSYQTSTDWKIQGFTRSNLFYTEGPVAFNGQIQNTSDSYGMFSGNIVIANMFGQTVGRIELHDFPVLAKQTRSLSNLVNHTLSRNSNLPNWTDKVLFGKYTATLTITELNSKKPVTIQKATQFYAIPMQIVISGAVFLLLLIFIRKRYQKLSTN